MLERPISKLPFQSSVALGEMGTNVFLLSGNEYFNSRH